MDVGYLSYVKFIATEAPIFFGYIISVLASVGCFSLLGIICNLVYLYILKLTERVYMNCSAGTIGIE